MSPLKVLRLFTGYTVTLLIFVGPAAHCGLSPGDASPLEKLTLGATVMRPPRSDVLIPLLVPSRRRFLRGDAYADDATRQVVGYERYPTGLCVQISIQCSTTRLTRECNLLDLGISHWTVPDRFLFAV